MMLTEIYTLRGQDVVISFFSQQNKMTSVLVTLLLIIPLGVYSNNCT